MSDTFQIVEALKHINNELVVKNKLEAIKIVLLLDEEITLSAEQLAFLFNAASMENMKDYLPKEPIDPESEEF